MKIAMEQYNDYTTHWYRVLAHHRAQLSFCAAYLLPCACSENVLKKVETEVIGFAIPDEFKLNFLLRTLVKAVIKHIRECSDGTTPRYTDSAVTFATADDSLPTCERIAYFLRQILNCQTRDASLLMGMSDAPVETLLSLACRRLNSAETATKPGTQWLIGSASPRLPLFSDVEPPPSLRALIHSLRR